MDFQYVITGAVVIVVLLFLFVRPHHVWRRSPRRFWTIPIIAALAIVIAIPASEVDSPARIGWLVLGAVIGLGAGALRGSARFTLVGSEPDGRVAYRPNIVGIILLLVIFALHYLANFAADSDSSLQFVLTVLLTFGVGETFGWHAMVFWRWSKLAPGTGAFVGDAS